MWKSKLRKAATILTIISIVITFINVSFSLIVPMYLSYKLHNEVDRASSIGIIGGADGPTSVYLSSQPLSYTSTIIFALLSIAGILYLFFTRKVVK